MNKKLEMIFVRRSVRQYQDKAVSDEMVHDILEAAMAAPSAVAKDPWRFVVVKDKARLCELAEHLPHGKMLGYAALQ